MFKRILIAGLVVVGLSACTPAEMLLNDQLRGLDPGTTERIVRHIEAERPSIVQMIHNRFGAEGTYAVKVATCESGSGGDPATINPRAVNPRSGTAGVFQIHPFWNKPYHSDPVAQYIGQNWHNRFDPATNIEMAWRIRNTPRGWGHWACA